MKIFELILDESGSFSNKDEKYLIIGGILFEQNKKNEIESYFKPIHKKYCEILEDNELKASKNKKLRLPLFSHIGMYKDIIPIVYVIDKNKAYVFEWYDKNSFKYNKAIEWLIKDMAYKGLINLDDDKIIVKFDNINLSNHEKHNFKNWLPSQLKCVISVEEIDSKNSMGIQMADYIVNSFSKNKFCSVNELGIKLLQPQIIFFLKTTENDYIKSS